MRRPLGNDLNLGAIVGKNGGSLPFSREARATHLYVCGSTGTGKSKFLESLMRQDIKAWSNSKCGMLLLDPHGSLYSSLMAWMSWCGIDRPVIPIDLRRDDWIIAYNMLRQRKTADPAVIVSNFVQAMAYVWGESGTQGTPLFNRWASNILRTLYEKKLTLAEAEYLTDRVDKRRRQAMARGLSDRAAVRDYELLDELTPFQVDSQLGSTINRLYKFLATQSMKHMFGQGDVSLDLAKAMDEGHIVLVNLSTEGGRIDDEDASLFATLLLSDLWTTAKERGKGTDARQVKPFYVYIDEFQNFVTPTIAKNLDQARGYGIHLTLAHQFPKQLLHAGAHGQQVYDSVMVNARSKVVFQISGEENLRPLALDLFMGVMSADKIKHELYSTKVMGYVEAYRKAYGRSSGSMYGGGDSYGSAWGAGSGGTEMFSGIHQPGATPRSVSESESKFASSSNSNSAFSSESTSHSESDVPMLIPVMGKELSSVQFEPLEEQAFRAMAVLHDQQQRQCVARIAGARIPISIFTPMIQPIPVNEKREQKFTDSLLKRWSFALPMKEAEKRLSSRQSALTEKLLRPTVTDEATTARRQIEKAPQQSEATESTDQSVAFEPVRIRRKIK